jgi:hypothetical protein
VSLSPVLYIDASRKAYPSHPRDSGGP